MKRSEAEERVKALGGAAKSAVVKDLSFLVTNDPQSGSGKNTKARSLGIPIIDEDAFLEILEDPGRETLDKARERDPSPPPPLQGELF
jgi:DNA ligase (NAD+)